MGLSTSLLLIAVATAVVPLAMIGLSPPRTIRDLEKALVSATITLVTGAIVTHGFHGLSLFGVIHLLYLLVFVSGPVLFGAWHLLGRRAGMRRIDVIFGAVAALLAIVGLYATHVEPNWLRLDRVEVRAPVATALRIGVIADLQTPNIGAHELDAIDRLLDTSPDIVLVPGDWYQGDVETLEANRQQFVDLLAELVAGSQLVAVVSGDSDHEIPLQPIVEEAGALFVDDTIVGFEVNGITVRLAGIRVVADGPDRANTLNALATPTDAFTILLSHRPDAVYDLPEGHDVDLTVSGHTHGGQVQIPFLGPPITFSDIPRDLAGGGLGVVDGVPLYVSAGVGMERLQAPQVRFGARPEIGIIDVLPR